MQEAEMQLTSMKFVPKTVEAMWFLATRALGAAERRAVVACFLLSGFHCQRDGEPQQPILCSSEKLLSIIITCQN